MSIWYQTNTLVPPRLNVKLSLCRYTVKAHGLRYLIIFFVGTERNAETRGEKRIQFGLKPYKFTQSNVLSKIMQCCTE